MKRIFTFCIWGVFSITLAAAAEESVKVKMVNPVTPARVEIPLGLTFSTDLKATDSDEKTTKFIISPALSYALNSDLSAGIETSIINTIRSSRNDSELDNTAFTLTKSVRIFTAAKTDVGVITLAPTARSASQYSSYRGSLGIQFSLQTSTSVLQQGIALSLLSTLMTHDFQFSRDRAGEPNPRHELELLTSAKLGLGARWDFGLSAGATTAQTFSDRFVTQYKIRESFIFRASPHTQWSLGHSNGGDVLDTDGHSRRVNVVNPRTSTVFVSVKFM